MKQVNLFNLLCMFCCVACALFFSPAADVNAQENRSSRQYINGTVVSIGGRSAGRSRPFTLIVNGYTASNQVRELNDALQPGGQDGQDGCFAPSQRWMLDEYRSARASAFLLTSSLPTQGAREARN